MPHTTKHTNRAIALAGASLFSLCALTLGLGCSDRSQPDADASPTGVVRQDNYQDILGVVATVPVAGKPGSEFKIHHEHIPGFKSKDGVVFVAADGVPGMKSMVMAFPLGPGISLDGIEAGDKVRFSFEVNWGGSPPWRVTALEEIDADTVIDFGNKVNAVSPTDAQEDSGHDHGNDHDGHDGHDHSQP